MEVLLREWRGGNGDAYIDRVISAKSITIGSGPDCLIQLPGVGVAARHARLRQAGGDTLLEVGRRHPAQINQARAKRSVRLQVGDEVDIAGCRIKVIAPPPQFDLALTLSPVPGAQPADPESGFKTPLDHTWLSRRRMSWLLFLLIPVMTLFIPLRTVALRNANHHAPGWLPDDSFWTAGPLSPAHALRFNGQCTACHRELFVHVRDEDCRTCHKTVTDDHVTPAHRGLTQLGSDPKPCRTCHQEHQSDGGSIIVRNNALCVACHARPAQLFGQIQLGKVSGFSDLKSHPPFTATVINAAPAPAQGVRAVAGSPAVPAIKPGVVPTAWPVSRVPVLSAREHSNLKEYSHKVHLDPTQVSRNGNPLGCSDCHALGLDGQHFNPVTMQANCTEGCHELKFDEDAPERTLPHGKPRDAVLLIEDYYAHKFFDPRATIPVRLRRRLPDKPEPEDLCRGLLGPPLGKCLAETETVAQFQTIGCGKCHLVEDGGPGKALEDRFRVHPVRFSTDYFPRASFSHRLHAIQDGKTGDAACLSCHAADQSTDITQLMLPDRDRCLKCHADQPIKDRVQLECTSCHGYHLHR
jgi:predicted CXXCH cytochrome family protein